MSDTVNQIISGRIVSGNPFGLSTIVSSYGKVERFYYMTVAIKKDSMGMKSLFDKVINLKSRKWPEKGLLSISERDFDWGFKEYDGYVGNDEPYVEYCLGCCLLGIREEQVPLMIMPDGQGGWKSIRHPGEIKVGDHVKVELELSISDDDGLWCLHFKPNFVALFETGEKVDFESDTAESYRKILLAKASRILGKSPDLLPDVVFDLDD